MEEPRSFARRPRGPGVNNNSGSASFSRAQQRHIPEDNFVFVPKDDPLMRPQQQDEPRSMQRPQLSPLAPAPVQQQLPQEAVRVIKIGEKLSKRYDTSEVAPEDLSSVMAAIYTICTLETSAPELDISIKARNGYYAIIVKKFNEFIDIPNMYRELFGDPDPKTNIVGGGINPETGVLIVRSGMQSEGHPIIESSGGGGGGGGGPRKRGRHGE